MAGQPFERAVNLWGIPFMTGTFTYDFGMPGHFSVGLQRAYYIEEIMLGDNFNANVLAIRWLKLSV